MNSNEDKSYINPVLQQVSEEFVEKMAEQYEQCLFDKAYTEESKKPLDQQNFDFNNINCPCRKCTHVKK